MRLHDKRARLTASGREEDAKQLLDEIRKQHSATLRARSEIESSRGKVGNLDIIAAALERHDRCLVHVAYESGYFNLFWLRYVNGVAVSGYIDISKLDSRGLVEAMAAWWSSRAVESKQHALRKALDIVGEGVAAPLAKELPAAGVKHLILSPTTLLELLPLHCAPVDASHLLVDVFEHVTYVPSARVLCAPSVITSKAANGYHFKTGQRERRSRHGFLLLH